MLGVQVFKYVEQTETLYCSKNKWDHIANYWGSIFFIRKNALLISKIVVLDSEPLH